MIRLDKVFPSDDLVPLSSICWNDACVDYVRVNAGNIRKFDLTQKGHHQWQCRICGKVITEAKGKVFHCKKHDEKTIIECFAMLAKEIRLLRSIASKESKKRP